MYTDRSDHIPRFVANAIPESDPKWDKWKDLTLEAKDKIPLNEYFINIIGTSNL